MDTEHWRDLGVSFVEPDVRMDDDSPPPAPPSNPSPPPAPPPAPTPTDPETRLRG